MTDQSLAISTNMRYIKIIYSACNTLCVHQVRNSLNYCYLRHKKVHTKPIIYKSSLVSHCINTKLAFPDTEHTKLNKSIDKEVKWRFGKPFTYKKVTKQ